MPKRQTIYVEGYVPANPIPSAARKGPLVVTGAIEGIDPETRKIAPMLDRQIELTFFNLERILAAAGCSWSDVLKLDFLIRAPEVRSAINDHWLRIYPNADDRPARHVRISETLPEKAMLQVTAIAWAGV